MATAPTVTSSVYPAFSLSGDYLLTGAFTLSGTQYTCSVKIEVRAPGIRAEGCWDTESLSDDVDLHMAKVDDFHACATDHTWSESRVQPGEDCYYGDCWTGDSALSGTPTAYTDDVNWGYPSSPAASCNG